MSLYGLEARPTVAMFQGQVFLHGAPARVVLQKDKISVGCTDITVAAMRHLLAEHDKKFAVKPELYVLQEGPKCQP